MISILSFVVLPAPFGPPQAKHLARFPPQSSTGPRRSVRQSAVSTDGSQEWPLCSLANILSFSRSGLKSGLSTRIASMTVVRSAGESAASTSAR